MSFLLDTNVVSELAKARPNPGVLTWASQLIDHVISAITIEEIRSGLAAAPNPRIEAFMDAFFQRETILVVTAEIARQSGNLRGGFKRRGIVREQADMLIAATAQAHGLTLVTRNTRDFENCGIALLNPFTD